MKFLKLNVSTLAIALASQLPSVQAMDETKHIASWDHTPIELKGFFCSHLDNNALLNLRVVNSQLLHIVDGEFHNRAKITTPLECLTVPDKSHPTPHTISYFLRKRLWEIPAVFSFNSTDLGHGDILSKCSNLCDEWNYPANDLVRFAAKYIVTPKNTLNLSPSISAFYLKYIKNLMENNGCDSQELLLWCGFSSGELSPNNIIGLFKESIKKLCPSDGKEIISYYASLIGEYFSNQGSFINAKNFYQIAADQGNTNAQVRLAELFPVVDGDFETRTTYYKIAADLGNPEAQFKLGKILIKDGEIDLGLKYLETSANKGYDQADLSLASYYKKNGDLNLAKKYYKNAAYRENANSQHQADACFKLGKIYEQENNVDEAKLFYKMAQEDGYSAAKVKLGNIFHNEGNLKVAKYYFQKAAEAGNEDGQYNLALILEKEGDIDEAIRYCNMAAYQGHTESQFYLGLLLHYKKRQTVNAMHYWKMAADKGHINAQSMFGTYSDKFGNNFDAITYWRMAAEQGCLNSQHNLGVLYGEEGNLAEGIKYLKMAAEQGVEAAQEDLKDILEIEKNLIEHGFLELKRTADEGDVNALYELGSIYYEENLTKLALKLWKEAANQGHAQALYRRGKHFSEHEGIIYIDYFKAASKKGHTKAPFA